MIKLIALKMEMCSSRNGDNVYIEMINEERGINKIIMIKVFSN